MISGSTEDKDCETLGLEICCQKERRSVVHQLSAECFIWESSIYLKKLYFSHKGIEDQICISSCTHFVQILSHYLVRYERPLEAPGLQHQWNVITRYTEEKIGQTISYLLPDNTYLVLDTWSSEGRNGLLTVAEEVLPKAVSPSNLIWERPNVLASRGRWRRRQTAEATSALTSCIFMYVRPLVITGVDKGNMLTPSALISTDTEEGQAVKNKHTI